ncbi:MAG: hypothetical protein E7261_07855 [Lachnospiraceae bacterium]|nr:hypothetical protein [Lachnospiraceae bacterium]
MKKYLSVFGLYARSSIYRALGVLLAMGVAEFGLFYYALDRALLVFEAGVGDGMAHFEELVTGSKIPWCFTVAFILITIFLCLPGTEFQSKTGYTLRRLSISERSVLLVQWMYNMAVYIILLAVQLFFCFALSHIYISQVSAEFIGNQTVFLTFYRSEFMHALLPLSEAGMWFRNAFLVIGLGFAAAEFSYNQRMKGYGIAIIVLGIFAIVSFRTEMGSIGGFFFTIIVVAFYVGNAIYNLLRKEVVDENGLS